MEQLFLLLYNLCTLNVFVLYTEVYVKIHFQILWLLFSLEGVRMGKGLLKSKDM